MYLILNLLIFICYKQNLLKYFLDNKFTKINLSSQIYLLIFQMLKMFGTRRINVAVCTLNNWALDFEGNRTRILKSKNFFFYIKFIKLVGMLIKKVLEFG